jgi:hypothetical protein
MVGVLGEIEDRKDQRRSDSHLHIASFAAVTDTFSIG